MRTDLAPRTSRDRVIVALDLPSLDAVRRMMDRLGETVTFYKIGMELVFAGGLALIPEMRAAGKRVFLDMKLLDIDNTVTAAVARIGGLGATFTTVHAYPKAMRAAASVPPAARPGLLAVTVLTSMDDADLREAGYGEDAPALVARRTEDAVAAGVDGLVCSPLEVSNVRRIVGGRLAIVTPGIRPAGSAADDQRRTTTAANAIRAGADYLVVGRPITAAGDPRAAAETIIHDIEQALEDA